jgi:hypothetical protein
MKLDCILTACNDNPMYCDFIPIFIKTWNKLYPGVDVKIIFISDSIPEKFKEYNNNIILYKPEYNIPTAFISQYIRLLYPALLNYTNGILITDMDMLPMNKTYYKKNIEEYSDDKFIYLRDVCMEYSQIAMCYNVAINKIWKEIFNINSIEDINIRLKNIIYEINNNYQIRGNGWCIDQCHLYKYVKDWNIKTNNFIKLSDCVTGFSRLDRCESFSIKISIELENKIKSGFYSDYHCLRPYSTYKEINDKIYNLL